MMRLSEASRAMHAQFEGPDSLVDSVGIDTRQLEREALYFAIHGETKNGHQFIPQAISNGAVAVVVDEAFAGEENIPHIQVEDTTRALGELGSWWRDRFDIPVVGVTGSNGKTTVCRILSYLFEDAMPGIAPQGSFNNHWGVPLTLLKLRKWHQSAVIEMGMNHAGELDYLGRIVRPSIGLITNAAAAHLEGLSSIEGVASAKGELIDHVLDEGMMVLNRDDQFFAQWKARAGERNCLSFGTHVDSDIRVLAVESRGLALSIQGQVQRFEFALMGQHNRLNAAAAVAVAVTAGVSLDAITRALKKVSAVPGRMDARQVTADFLLLDDSYNANPASMRAAIDVLAEQSGQRVLVLGAMGELGADSEHIHEQVAAYASSRGIDALVTLVDRSDASYLNDMAAYLRGFGKSGRAFSEVDKLVNNIRIRQRPVTVLVKGSRFAGMERVVNALLKERGKNS